MLSMAAQFAQLIPPVWPSEEVKGVHSEDTWPQGSTDILLTKLGHPRNPARTGSARAIATAGAPYHGSGNHLFSEQTLEALRSGNQDPITETVEAQKETGHLCIARRDETLSPYRTFYQRDGCMLLPFAQPPLRAALLEWFGFERWCLEACEWPKGSGDVYSPGRRWHADENGRPTDACPDFRLRQFLKILRGRWREVNTTDRRMGFAPGSIMNGGLPTASNVWAGLIAAELTFLPEVKPAEPKLSGGRRLRVDRSDSGILAYIDGPMDGNPPTTVLAVEMHREWQRPRLYTVAGKVPRQFNAQQKEIE